MTYKRGSDDDAYELLTPSQKPSTQRTQKAGLLSFLAQNLSVPVALVLGCAGAIGCFYFTHWLSEQIPECPDWALWCTVQPSVSWIWNRYQQVQGIVSAVYGICISSIAYAVYQLAETALWPILAQRSLTFTAIDQYLATARGSLPSAPSVLAQARQPQHILVLLIVITISVLLKVDSIIVGHAYSISQVPTRLYSNQSVGGGTGIPFIQMNPPATLPGAVTGAYLNYLAWANGRASEPMPEYRNFIVDRVGLHNVGNLSVNAVEADVSVTCNAFPIDLDGIVYRQSDRNPDPQWQVQTSGYGSLYVRLQPVLSIWVDDSNKTGDTSATTRLVFAAINGTIEGGYNNTAPANSSMAATHSYYGVSTLACDVDVRLFDSHMCTYTNPLDCITPNVTLTSTTTMNSHGGMWTNAVWLAAVIETYGISIAGAQPLFASGPSVGNGSRPLPIPWTSTNPDKGNSPSWVQADLTNFILVGSGALAVAMATGGWVKGQEVLESMYPMNRMSTARAYILLLAPGLAAGSVLLLALLSVTMHTGAKVPVIRLGNTASVVFSSQTADVREMVDNAKHSSTPEKALSKQQLRYGMMSNGSLGLSGARKINGS